MPIRTMLSVLPSSLDRQKEATKMYKAIQKVKEMTRPMHLTLQEGNQGRPSRTDIKSILGSDQTFYTMEYIKTGKTGVTNIFSEDN
jgi:hypothetical protein